MQTKNVAAQAWRQRAGACLVAYRKAESCYKRCQRAVCWVRTTVVDAIEGDRDKSLASMRREMLSGPFHGAVFIGGMEGVVDEYALFTSLHPGAVVLPLYAPGGAARDLAVRLGVADDRLDFTRLFSDALGIGTQEDRNQV